MDSVDKPAKDREGISRRGFLAWATGILGLIGGLAVAVPLVGALVEPVLGVGKRRFVQVRAISTLPQGVPTQLPFADQSQDAFIRETVQRNVWAVKHSATDIVVFSPICPHLGCYYSWNPGTKHFECPCHASVFSIDGKVLAGPAPRSLDRLPVKIEKGVLFVGWEQFKPGIPVKELIQ